jgi:hypothetical protein
VTEACRSACARAKCSAPANLTVPAQEYAALTSTLLLVDDIDERLLIAETDGKMTGANIVDDPDLVEGLKLWSSVLRYILGAFKLSDQCRPRTGILVENIRVVFLMCCFVFIFGEDSRPSSVPKQGRPGLKPET